MTESLYSSEIEYSCLAAVIKYPTKLYEVNSIIDTNDFYYKNSQVIFHVLKEEILSYGKTTIDLVILSERIGKLGFRSSDSVDISTLLDSLSVRIVTEQAFSQYFEELKKLSVARRITKNLLEIKTDISQNIQKPLSEILSKIDEKFYSSTQIEQEQGSVCDIFGSLIDTIETRGNNPVEEVGYVGPFQSVNNMYGSLLTKGDITLIGARTGVGKAHPAFVEVLTSNGKKPIGDIHCGDEVIGSNGETVFVRGVFPQGKKTYFKVTFSDGTFTFCCEDHLWQTATIHEKRYGRFSVKSLREIRKTLKRKNHPNHEIPVGKAVKFKYRDLSQYKLDAIKYGRMIKMLCRKHEERRMQILRSFNARILPDYLYSCIQDRSRLLNSLFANYATKIGRNKFEIRLPSEELCEDVAFLARSLGGYVVYKSFRRIWKLTVVFPIDSIPFSANDLKLKNNKGGRIYEFSKKIVKVEEAGEDFCYCIRVSAPDSLYMVNDCIVTHNTSLAFYYLTHVAEKYNVPVVHLDNGEMTQEQLIFRSACMLSQGRVPVWYLKTGQWRKNPEFVKILRDEVWKRVEKLQKNGFYYANIGGLNPNEVINTIRKIYYSKIGRGNPFLCSFDYLKPFRDESNAPEWKVMGHFIQDLKTFITGELQFPLWTSLQLNRTGITGNKTIDTIDDTENTFSTADRIIQQCSSAFLVRRKLPEEINCDGERFGNIIFKALKTRDLGKNVENAINFVAMPDGKMKPNYVNLLSHNFCFEDKGDLRDIVAYKTGQIVETGRSQRKNDFEL